jgi:hypothetical protein
MEVAALDPADARRLPVRVAGTAALLVAKLHKIGERETHRLNDKDAHDVYRLLVAAETDELATSFATLLSEAVSAEITSAALSHLASLFAAGPEALGSTMAGRAEEGVGEPETVSQAVAFLAADVVDWARREG